MKEVIFLACFRSFLFSDFRQLQPISNIPYTFENLKGSIIFLNQPTMHCLTTDFIQNLWSKLQHHFITNLEFHRPTPLVSILLHSPNGLIQASCLVPLPAFLALNGRICMLLDISFLYAALALRGESEAAVLWPTQRGSCLFQRTDADYSKTVHCQASPPNSFDQLLHSASTILPTTHSSGHRSADDLLWKPSTLTPSS